MEMDPANRYENVEQLKNELEKIKDNGFGSGSYNDMAVSYTHLDVYKRQEQLQLIRQCVTVVDFA